MDIVNQGQMDASRRYRAAVALRPCGDLPDLHADDSIIVEGRARGAQDMCSNRSGTQVHAMIKLAMSRHQRTARSRARCVRGRSRRS